MHKKLCSTPFDRYGLIDRQVHLTAREENIVLSHWLIGADTKGIFIAHMTYTGAPKFVVVIGQSIALAPLLTHRFKLPGVLCHAAKVTVNQ